MPEASKRAIKYAVVPIATVRTFNVRTDEEVIDAQSQVNDEMLHALEEMINTARAGRLSSVAALSTAAASW